MISHERLIEKIHALPKGRLPEVEDFVDFISSRSAAKDRDIQIARFAAEFGGTDLDLDEDLESAGIEVLNTLDKETK